jgi:hypothetical protein
VLSEAAAPSLHLPDLQHLLHQPCGPSLPLTEYPYKYEPVKHHDGIEEMHAVLQQWVRTVDVQESDKYTSTDKGSE